MSRCIGSILFVVGLLWLGASFAVSGAVSGAPETIAELWSGNFEPGTYVAALGNLVDDEAEELILGANQAIRVYTWDPGSDTYALFSEITDVSAGVSALALGGFIDENHRELLVGTAGSGLIRVYRLSSQGQPLAVTVGRLWSTVRQILSVDTDGDGQREILALSDLGEVVLFQRGADGYTELWRERGGNNPARHVVAGDVTGDGLPEIIIGREQGNIAVYGRDPRILDGVTSGVTAQTWTILYEGFPWGAIRSIGLADIQRNGRLDILALTDQGQLYVYGYKDASWNLQHTWDMETLLSAHELHMLHAYPPDRPIWLGLTPDGLRAWELIDGSLVPFWQTDLTPQAFFQGVSGSMITIESDGRIRLLGGVPANFVRVLVNDRAVELTKPILLEDSEMWLAARDWQSILSVRAWFTRNGERWTGVGPGFQLFIVDAGGTTVWVNGSQRDIAPAARMIEAELYLPIAIGERLGYKVDFDEVLRTLEITRR